jgi:hypothetical protein
MPLPEVSEEGKDLRSELTAMEDIALALSQLDEPTRVRVLRWADERFRGDSPAPAASAPAPLYAVSGLHETPAEASVADEGLSMDALETFFERCDSGEAAASAAKRASTLHEDIEDLQGLEGLDVLEGVEAAVAVAAPEQSVVGMLHDFVAEFQDIVEKWNGACAESESAPVEDVDEDQRASSGV